VFITNGPYGTIASLIGAPAISINRAPAFDPARTRTASPSSNAISRTALFRRNNFRHHFLMAWQAHFLPRRQINPQLKSIR